MSIPTIDDLMSATVSELTEYTLLEAGDYYGVITDVESRPGKKAPYLNVEVTIHQAATDEDGEQTGHGRKVWRNVSFSEKAITMPGGVANLVQVTKPDIKNASADDLPGAIAVAIQASPIGVTVGHEQAWDGKAGKPKVDENGNPVMRESIDSFFEAPESFIDSFEAESIGVDNELPF